MQIIIQEEKKQGKKIVRDITKPFDTYQAYNTLTPLTNGNRRTSLFPNAGKTV
jgi:hypothetical protein